MLGIPTSDQISAIIATAIASEQTAGLVLEDHATASLNAAITTALAGVLSDVGPVLETVNQISALMVDVLAFLKRLDGAVLKTELVLAPPPPPVPPLA
jgi:hypothetical protein